MTIDTLFPEVAPPIANPFAERLEALQNVLRLAMMSWSHHHKGINPIVDHQAFEDLLVEANFALCDIRLELSAHLRETAKLARDQQAALEGGLAIMQDMLALLDRLQAAPSATSAPVKSNVIVFTGSYRPRPDNDVSGDRP